jgi:uncharacterized protein
MSCMTTKAPLLALALLAALPLGAAAAPVFPCSDPNNRFEAVCADRELVSLAKAVDARFGALVRQADPVTAQLLRRDQDWFAEILGGDQTEKFADRNDPERRRIKDLLTHRLATLGAIRPAAIAATPAGTWANALATLALHQVGSDTLRVTVAAKLAYPDRDDTLVCNVTGTVRPDGTGCFAGNVAEKDGETATIRLRLQGASLRLVRSRDDHAICEPLEMLTGSYFPINPATTSPTSALAQRTVSPSFRCATARSSDEREICADPELAARDVEVAGAYGETLRRLDPQLAAQLRADQRAWVKDNVIEYDTDLHPAWDKRGYMLHHTDSARDELMRRFDTRLAMLLNLDEKREGLAGLWVAYNAVVTIEPAKNRTDGTMTAEGHKWLNGEYKAHCRFDSNGRIEGGAFRPDEAFPTLTRDGATLVVSAEDPDGDDNPMPPGGHPVYCTRMHSAKARLFPLKPEASADDFDRVR